MKLRTIIIAVFGSSLILLAGSCSPPISQQLRNEAQQENVTFPMVLANPAAYNGRIVLWGGKIIETTNIPNGSEMVVLETPLDFLGVPEGEKLSRGRFIARSPQFCDPAIYSPDREITLAGEVVGAEEKTLGKTTYKYPVVMIKELHLWDRYIRQNSGEYYWYEPYYYGPGRWYYHDDDHHGDHDNDQHRGPTHEGGDSHR